MKILNILVVEDDFILREFIKNKLSQFGRVFEAANLGQARDILQNAPIQLSFIDLNLNSNLHEMEGLLFLEDCQKKKIKSVILTSHEDQEIIDQAFRLGCSHFFAKRNLKDTFEKYILNLFRKQERVVQFKNLIRETIQTKDPKFENSLIDLFEKSIQTDQSILILGETGVGKTQLAKLIHQLTLKDRPFVNKNLNEISTSLLESELFGHKKGSFTGALQDKEGLLERANGGTLFLDEIGSLSKETQQKLLKVIEEREFMSLGSTEVKKSHFRLISATCEPLDRLVEKGKFRIDFYFRIKGIEFTIPPLRERIQDLPNLFQSFTSKSARKLSLSSEALELLQSYPWPGNIREFKQLCETWLSGGESYITPAQLPQYIITGPNSKDNEEEALFLSPSLIHYIQQNGLPELIKKIEFEAMRKWQEKHPGKINAVAKELKISKSVFYRILEGLNES